MEKLFVNLRKYPIPMCMLHQYMPEVYTKIEGGTLLSDPKDLALNGIFEVIFPYEKAASL